MGSMARGSVAARCRRRSISSSSVPRQPWRRRTGFLVLRDLAGLVEPERGRILGMGDFYHMAGACGGGGGIGKTPLTPAPFFPPPPPPPGERGEKKNPPPGPPGDAAGPRPPNP